MCAGSSALVHLSTEHTGSLEGCELLQDCDLCTSDVFLGLGLCIILFCVRCVVLVKERLVTPKVPVERASGGLVSPGGARQLKETELLQRTCSLQCPLFDSLAS